MNSRKISIDIAKTIAIICVILIHTTIIINSNVPSLNFLWHIFTTTLPRIAVPLFLMCSGVLLLDTTKEITIKKLYKRYIPRILFALIIFSVLYKLFHLILAHTFSTNDFKLAILDLLLFKDEFHLYYLHIILLVYVFLPITKIFINNASKKEIEYILIVIFILGIVFPTVRYLDPNFHLTGIPRQWGLNMTYTSIGYTILGYYIDKYGFSTNESIFSIIFGISFAVIGTYLLSAINNKHILSLYEGMSLGVCLYSLGIFSLIGKIKELKSEKATKLFIEISKASFTIYLVHIFYLIILNTYYSINNTLLKALIIFVMSYITYKILEKIPFFKKWVI